MEKKLFKIRTTIYALSALSIYYGIYRNEIDTVFRKAVQICLECIGIG